MQIWTQRHVSIDVERNFNYMLTTQLELVLLNAPLANLLIILPEDAY